jgi:hypothetical protein
MEKKLVKFLVKIVRQDAKQYLYYKDETFDEHFRMGLSEGPCIEFSFGKEGEDAIGTLIIRKDSRTELKWPVVVDSELSDFITYMIDDAIMLSKDQDYLARVANEEERQQMIANVGAMVALFFESK